MVEIKLEKLFSGNSKSLPQDTRALQGVWVFLSMLGVFFFSSILLFVVYVALRISPETGDRMQSFYLPRSFLPSTLLLIGVSVVLEWALRSATKDRHDDVKRATTAAFVMGILFLLVQSEGMFRLLASSHNASPSKSAYALTFVLALLHALHVIGGQVGLVITMINAMRVKYDHERNFGLKFCALYWHFLDVVWIFLMASFIVTGWMVNRV